MAAFMMPHSRGAAAHEFHLFADDDQYYNPYDEVRPCEGLERSMSLCPTMSPGMSMMVYRHSNSWKWQWRHAHYDLNPESWKLLGKHSHYDAWECLNACGALGRIKEDRKPTPEYTIAAQKQDCVNSCQQYFVEKKPY